MKGVRVALSLGMLACLSAPSAEAIIVSGTNPNDSVWSASSLGGLAFFGNPSSGSCSGALFEPSLTYVVTAAHCVSGLQSAINAGTAYVQLGTNGSGGTFSVSAFTVNPGYNSSNIQIDDIAVLQLANSAPAGTQYYPIFNGDGVGQDIIVAGYGDAGTGITGDAGQYPYYDKIPRMGNNVYQFTSAGSQGLFNPSGTDLLFDFVDSGNVYNPFLAVNTVYGTTLSAINPYFAVTNEASIAGGDSGGPSLIDVNGTLEIAGIHSFTACIYTNGCPNGTPGQGYGTIAGDTNAALFVSFINSAIGATAAPEPGTWGLLVVGLGGLEMLRRRILSGKNAG